VVGDFFLDKYLHIDPRLSETSLETGLEAFQVVAIRHSPGAAGTVMSNLSALQVGHLFALGVIGQDGQGYELKEGLHARRINTDYLLETADRFTPTYTKPMRIDPGGRLVEMNRIDIKNRTPTPPEIEERIISSLRACIPGVQGVIIADQVQEENCGVITQQVRSEIARLAEAYPSIVFLADSRVRIGRFRNVMIKPNQSEAVRAIFPEYDGPLTRPLVEECGLKLFQQNRRPVFVTLGADGMLVFDETGQTHVPGVRVAGEIDIVGAGDSATAGIVTSLCAGASHTEAALVGNLVASITIQQIGTTGTASPEQVLQRLAERKN